MSSTISNATVAPAARVRRGTTASTVFAAFAGLMVLMLVSLPQWGGAATQRKIVELMVLIAMTQMWNLLAGFGGVVSVGQQAFVGLAAYSMIFFVNVHGQDLFLSIPLAALVAAVLAVPIGLLAFRLRGSYFAIGTWVIAEVCSKLMIIQKPLGAGDGASLKVNAYDVQTRQDVVYYLALVVGLGAIALAYFVLRSRLGLQMQAIRDNEGGARGLGVNVYRVRFILWVLAALWTGFASAVYYTQQLRVQPVGTGGAFSVVLWTAPIVFVCVIGGLGTIEGPIIGAVAFYYLRSWLDEYENWYLIGTGVVCILVALLLQKGLWGTLRKYTGIDLFPVRRRVIRPDN
jgi:branched-chain amino acid transport system permease protein